MLFLLIVKYRETVTVVKEGLPSVFPTISAPDNKARCRLGDIWAFSFHLLTRAFFNKGLHIPTISAPDNKAHF